MPLLVENMSRDREYPGRDRLSYFHISRSQSSLGQTKHTDKVCTYSGLELAHINHTLRLLSPPLTISIVHPPSLLLPVGNSGLVWSVRPIVWNACSSSVNKNIQDEKWPFSFGSITSVEYGEETSQVRRLFG